MAFNKEQFANLIEEFTVKTEQLREIAADFRYDLRLGLKDPDQSSLRMLKSYVGLPTGKETGEYLALDFGGTNLRVLRIKLLGEGKFEVLKKVAKPLKVEGVYDFIGADSTAEEMFDFIAELVDEAVEGDHTTKYLLGHTFSFPSEQTDLYNAKLIIWTKEFATPGVEGKVVNDLLKEALHRQGIDNVEPTAVINDTVAVLLAAAYKQPDIYIGSIYATGHNTCYLEPYADSADAPMILNLESGGFMKLVPSRLDIEFDKASEKPGEQRLEKMVSGRYMGELFGMALAELLDEKGKNYGFTSIDMSNIILDESADKAEVVKIVAAKTGKTIETADAEMVRDLASALVVRSARLVTASFVGIIWQLAGEGKAPKQHIAVDGSVYEKMPLAKENIMRALSELLGEEASVVDTVLENGGSGLGAAIAAAMSQK
ncbi:putative hexokinase [Selenomonas ruminantium subsp. lactilytica TAM6421]|uniref:Putative hexokinase n=1 Tax=Selenomonas ruminantium subsp. lactilytica (strain NBRC 103574 / TAM6421) TaxID=927704 RepID=I0GRA5_SELRL|nr:hexokinase [Selenomonas ruminantium]BAL83292.1 putative hexokinase [Selenomonas ruminantium subsp. lactilytica TAM6421]